MSQNKSRSAERARNNRPKPCRPRQSCFPPPGRQAARSAGGDQPRAGAGEESLEIFSAKAQIQFDLEIEEAAKSYAKVLSMHPKHAAANFHMAVCLEKLGRWQEAADFFEKAAESNPSRLDARLGLGICQLHLDKAEAAAESFEQRACGRARNIPRRCSAKP